MICAQAIPRRTTELLGNAGEGIHVPQLRLEARDAFDSELARLSVQFRYHAWQCNRSKVFLPLLRRRLPAEVMLDAVSAATDVPDEFKGYPLGTRAVQFVRSPASLPTSLRSLAVPIG